MLYETLIASLGNEIGILCDVEISEIREIDASVGNAVDALRRGDVEIIPGGGGKYGRFSLHG